MTRLRTARRWIALIVAYAIALQVLLPVALAVAVPAGFPVCSPASAAAGGDRTGRDRETGQRDCCAVMCCAPVLATPPQPSVPGTRPSPDFAAATIAPEAPSLLSIRGPQSPRAPPRS